MLKHSIAFSLLIPLSQARAFDPTSVGQIASTAANMYTGGAFGSMMNETAGVGFAFGDLLVELGVDQTANESIQASLARIEDLQSKMSQVQGSAFQMGSMVEDLKTSQSLADRMQTLRKMIQISKSLAALMSGSPKVGEMAFKVQDVRLNYMILDELMAMRRSHYQELLKIREREARLGIALAGVNEEERKASKKRGGR